MSPMNSKEIFQKNSAVRSNNIRSMYCLLKITKNIFRITQLYIVVMVEYVLSPQNN